MNEQSTITMSATTTTTARGRTDDDDGEILDDNANQRNKVSIIITLAIHGH